MCSCDKLKERMRLYVQCASEVLESQLGEKITDEKLAYIELLIQHKYDMSLEDCLNFNSESKNH